MSPVFSPVSAPFESRALNITKVAAPIGGALGVAVAAVLVPLAGQSDAIKAAALGVVGLLALATGLVIAVDILARAWVAAKNPSPPAAGSSPSHSLICPVSDATVTVRGAGAGHHLLAIRWDSNTGQTSYLAGRSNETPHWRRQEEVDDVVYSSARAASGRSQLGWVNSRRRTSTPQVHQHE